MTGDVLIRARELCFSVPVVLPRERSLLKNPFGLIADLYVSREQRKIVSLLSGINFELATGDRLALIGHNGAGKTTLLRMLGGIYGPTSGTLETNCVPQGFFDISLGFSPIATGLENIYLRGLQIGLSLKQLRGQIREIVAFSGLENHIDKPLGTFSVGMRLRLALAISLTIQPDVLLLDEWIGSGDVNFREKIAERMDKLLEHSRALILASHNENLLKKICTSAIVLANGRIEFAGGVEQALDFYNGLEISSSKEERI